MPNFIYLPKKSESWQMTPGNFRSEEIARLCSFINFGSAISGNWDE
jgi:hypothetical protein